MVVSIYAKDLTKTPPRAPWETLGDYVVLPRTIDKGRAFIAGTNGVYLFDTGSPLDKMLFSFKEVSGFDMGEMLATGADDDEVLAWFNVQGIPRSPEEVRIWSAAMMHYSPFDDPAKMDLFIKSCKELGLNPLTATLFELLDADDKMSFPDKN